MEDVSVMKNITTRANEKPWISSEVNPILKAQHGAFKYGDMVALRTARAYLNHAIRTAKRVHAQKVQDFIHDPTNTR